MFVERRGKKGIIDIIVKIGIRLGQKISFLRKKVDDQLEKEAKKTIAEVLEKSTVKCTYNKMPENGESE